MRAALALGVLTSRAGFAQSSASFPEPSAPAPAAPPPAAVAPAAAPPPAAVAPEASGYEQQPGQGVLTYEQPATELPAQLSLASLPPVVPYRKGMPVPPGYRVEHRAATGLIVGGGVTFLAAYAGGLGLAASQNFENGMGYTAIPVLGPWGAIGARRFACKTAVPASSTAADVQRTINKCVGTAYDEVTTVVFLTADGLVQAAGFVLFFAGLASGYDELVRADLPKTAVTVLPEGGMAFSVSGIF